MRTIHKYEVVADIFAGFVIDMPIGAEPLSVQMQRGRPVLWALVNPEAPKVRRRFITVGTGHVFSEHHDVTFVGTFQMNDGDLVFHLFDAGEPLR